MSFLTLRNEIETVIGLISDCTYLRANPNQANIDLDKIDVGSGCLAIHIDRTTSTLNKSEAGNFVVKEIPTEILFVYKNTEIDDKQTDVDTLIDQAESKADEFFDRMIQSDIISDVFNVANAELDRLEGHKRFDAILSGILFRCTFPVNKNTYYCGN